MYLSCIYSIMSTYFYIVSLVYFQTCLLHHELLPDPLLTLDLCHEFHTMQDVSNNEPSTKIQYLIIWWEKFLSTHGRKMFEECRSMLKEEASSTRRCSFITQIWIRRDYTAHLTQLGFELTTFRSWQDTSRCFRKLSHEGLNLLFSCR